MKRYLARYFYKPRRRRARGVPRPAGIVLFVVAAVLAVACSGEGIPAEDPTPIPPPAPSPVVAPLVTPDPGVRPPAVAVP